MIIVCGFYNLHTVFQEPALEGGFSNIMELLSSSSPAEKARGSCLGEDRKRVSRRDMSGGDRKRVSKGGHVRREQE